MIRSIHHHFQRPFFLLMLLVAGAITSCKAPTAPASNGPVLTLSVPDTVYWGDSCMMSVSSSQPLQLTWRYSWSFGDSTTYSSQMDSVLHWYLNPGTYAVHVDLNDTAKHIPLGSRTATVHVVARHFDLALLQSMKYVDVTWNARIVGQESGNFQGLCTSLIGTKPLVWTGSHFSMDSSYNYNFSMPNDSNAGGGGNSTDGSLDSISAGLATFSQNTYFWSYQYSENGGSFCYSTSSYSFNINSVPFTRQSDSDAVFEADGQLIKNASYTNSASCDQRLFGQFSGSERAVFTDTSVKRYVRIRFHK